MALKVFNLDDISINIIDLDGVKHIIKTPVNVDLTLMDVLREQGFPMGHCGGMALCASCHCYIEHDEDISDLSTDEKVMLDQLHNSDVNQSRLICQIPCNKIVDGITIKIVKN